MSVVQDAVLKRLFTAVGPEFDALTDAEAQRIEAIYQRTLGNGEAG